MKASTCIQGDGGFQAGSHGRIRASPLARSPQKRSLGDVFWAAVNGSIDLVAPCPWSAHVGLSTVGTHTAWSHQPTPTIDLAKPPEARRTEARKTEAPRKAPRPPLYSPAERQRRDATPWTIVQGVLAPIQFLAFAISLALIFRYMVTGQGYAAATASILVKTALLYAIMITGSIWEKVVFGKWLFAKAFFWEDAFSMLVLGLQTAYLATLLLGWGTPVQQMSIAVAAYAAYAINASQFLLKLRAARLEAVDLSGLTA